MKGSLMRVFPWGAVILAIVLPGAVWSAPPEIRSIAPPGLQRGVETLLTFLGPGFGSGMELILPFKAEIKEGTNDLGTYEIEMK